MAYNRVNWKNGASGGTPVGATNLNIMDEGIANNDTEIEKLKTDKADKTEIPDVSTLATKTELGAKADKTELSAYMPTRGGIFTGNLEGDDDGLSHWQIDVDGTAVFETVDARQGFTGNLEGTSNKSKCLAEDMSNWDSIGTPSDYMAKGNGIYTEFKQSDAVGRTEKPFWNVTTIVQYENFVGNRPTQFATSEGIMLKRYGTSDTEWSAWEEVGSGGGGSAEWVGTKAEYEADKDNIPEGMIVNITDDYVEPTSGGGGNVYSDEEVVVGTWFGKPLYRKCFVINFSTPVTGETVLIDFAANIINLEKIPKIDTITTTNDGNVYYGNYSYNTYGIYYYLNNAFTFTRYYGTTKKVSKVELVVEYTKTTD